MAVTVEERPSRWHKEQAEVNISNDKEHRELLLEHYQELLPSRCWSTNSLRDCLDSFQEPRATERQVWANARVHFHGRVQDISSRAELKPAWIVASKDEAIFGIPLNWLRTSRVLAKLFSEPRDPQALIARQPDCLKTVPVQQFHDFYRWIHGDHICNSCCIWNSRATEDAAWRLIAAVRLGIYLDCAEYQLAALDQLVAFASFLKQPEDYVTAVWGATAGWAKNEAFARLTDAEKDQLVHPLRKLIVALVAVRTVGKYKRKVKGRPGYSGVERRDEILIGQFWTMYESYETMDASHGGRGCAAPNSIKHFL